MKRIVLLTAAAGLLAVLSLLVSCSSTGTSSTPKMVGDTTSSEFATASAVFDTTMQVGMDQFVGTIDIAGLAASASGAPAWGNPSSAVISVPVYHDNSKYWYLIRSGVEYVHSQPHPDSIVDSVTWTAVDSLQFRTPDSAVMKPDSASWTELRAGCSFVAHSETREDSLQAARSFTIVGDSGALWSRGDVVINANGSTHAVMSGLRPPEDTAAICKIDLSLMGVWGNIHANIADVSDGVACPTSGVMIENGSLAVGCSQGVDSVKFNGNWSASLTYNSGQVTVVYENPTTRWTATRPCPDNHVMVAAQKSDILRVK